MCRTVIARAFAAAALAAGLAGTPSVAGAQALNQLFVEALDARTGAPVPDLLPTDFRVEEDGSPAGIVSADIGDVPMKVALLVDNGDVLADTNAISDLRRALDDFLDTLAPAHEVGLFTIARQTRRRVDFTVDRVELKSRRGYPGAGARGRPVHDRPPDPAAGRLHRGSGRAQVRRGRDLSRSGRQRARLRRRSGHEGRPARTARPALLGRPRQWGAATLPARRGIVDPAGRHRSGAAGIDGVRRLIAPRNLAGLADPARRRLYPADVEALVAATDILGLTSDEMRTRLPRLRGEPVAGD